ncbi:MAG: DUF3754 domain-containing protein [Planctomycetota bacterium]|nr:DUF3754 domain-containing protein [Planctomycetota bacterium]
MDQKVPDPIATEPSTPELLDREHFIPLGRAELFNLLPEISSCSESEQIQLREFFQVLEAWVHYQYHGQSIEIQKLYQPLDPDSEFKFSGLTVDSPDQRSKHVFSRLQFLLERANYRKLSQDELELAVENASVLGIRLKVNLDLFEDLNIYARGNRVETWTKRTWWKFFRKEKFQVDVYQRLVIAFRLREHKLLSEDQATDVVYIKSFKSIPHTDMHALLPGTQIKMSLVDQGKIILPTLSGVAVNLFKLFRFLMLITVFATIFSTLQFTGLLIGVGLYVAKGIYSYIQTKDKHLLNLTRHLYFQNLDNNSGVVLRVLSEAESQDLREMMFAYYILWRFGQTNGLSSAELDGIAESHLQGTTELEIDFEVEDALHQLESLQLIYPENDRWHATKIDEALRNLDFRWDSVFPYHGKPRQTR